MKYFETKFQENSQIINARFEESSQNIDPKFQENEQNISPNFGETQLVHDGVNGATFIPSVSDEGVISWTNNGDLPNPKPVSIKGNAGEPGEKGDRGEDGYTPIKNVDYFDGKDGEDGKTPYIQDDYWYLDGQNLGVKAKGADGASITIVSSHISNESGGISTIKFSNGTELTVRNGKDGQRGEDGTDGVDGVSATHSWNGTILTVTSASGTSSVDLKGEKGDKGDGFKIERTFNSVVAMNAGFYSDGVPLHGFVLIETGNVNDEDNAKLFVKGVAQYHYLTDLSGAQGIKGEDGNDGKDGRGISSIAKTATNGLIDTYTITYTDKTQSTFNVVNGEKGTDGKSVGISSIYETAENGGTNIITFTDGKSISIKNGLKGEDGNPGKDGQDGYTPIKGVDYFDGKVGDKGDPGVDGKTAYEFAKDGGYTGTEEEFSAKLAEQFYVSPEMYKNLTDAVDKKLDANGVYTHSSESGEDVSLSLSNGVVLESSQDVGTIRINGGLEETQITATDIAGIPYSSIVKNTDMASVSKLGLVKVYSGYGVEIGTSGTLFTQKASNAEIDAKKHNYNVIVPSNLEYAVKSVAYDKGETDKAVGDAIDELSKTVNTALNEKLDAGGLNHNYDENNEIVELGIGNGVTVVSDKGEGQVTLTSGDTQTVIDANSIAGIEYQDILTVAQKGASNGIAELDKDGKIISSQLPSYVDDVIEGYYVAQNDEFYEDENHTIIIPVENGKIYVDLHENRTYRYGGTQYTEISPSIALGTTSSTAFRGDYGQAAYTHSQKTSGNPHNVSKTDVGLGNVNNTSDANKPVSTAQATAILDAKTNDVNGNAFQRVYSSLIPYGTSIPANADLNTTTYMKVGNYYCSKNVDAATLVNSPSTTAFMMTVSSPLSTTIDNENKTWVYRLRKLQVYTGAEYVQYCYTNGTAGNWIYGTWYLSIKSNNTASTTSAGLMSAADKTKLNGIDTQISNAVATKADKKAGVFYIEGDGSTDGVWTGTCSDITAYYEGLLIAYKTNIAGISDGTTLNINGLGAVSVVRNTTTAVTTHYGVGSVLMLVYTTDSSGTSYWKISDYDSDTKTRSSNNAGKKMFIIGATAQSTSGQTTYSNSNCYIGTNNRLYSGGELVSNVADIKAIIDEKTNSVKNYGAVGDGTTDDSTAFQNALAANTTVFVPNGTYLLSKTITIGANSQLELSQGTVLNFTQTTGICIKVGMLSSLKGNHATINVPYEFAGTVIFADSSELTSSDVNSIPPWSKWTPQWKSGRYVTDINICKADSRGFHYAVNTTDCKGNAVYLSSDGSADTQHYMWGIHYSGLRIAGAFAYGIYAVNFNKGWLHEMRIDAFIDACETGVCLEDCNNVYISAIVQPRRAYSTGGVYSPYAKNGIKLIRSANVDLSGSRVWDWNSEITLYSSTNQYQHIAMYGDCRGTIINDFSYHSYGDTRNRIYTDTANNLKTVTILQEPIDRWFKIKDGKPYYNDGDEDHKLITKEDLESHFITDTIPTFSNLLPIATDTDGSIFNGTGYGDGYLSPGKGIFTSSSSFKATGFIPIAKGETIYFKNLFLNNAISQGSSYTGFHLYKSDKTWSSQLTGQNMKNSGTSGTYLTFTATTDGFTVTTKDAVATAGLTYMRVSFMKAEFGANPIISKTPIGYKSQGFLADDIYIKSQNLMLLSPSGKEFKLSVDENGNLITTAV